MDVVSATLDEPWELAADPQRGSTGFGGCWTSRRSASFAMNPCPHVSRTGRVAASSRDAGRVLNTDTGRTEYLDLLCSGADGETAIEFKYFTRGWKGVIGGELFDLRAHAATDLLRLHFVHDIVRLERFGSASSGLAVLLTNESGLWTQSTRKSRDRDFHLHEGRQLSGALLWANGTYAPNTRELRGAYAFNWQDYSSLDDQRGGRFRYLAVEVSHAATPGSLGTIEPRSEILGPSD